MSFKLRVQRCKIDYARKMRQHPTATEQTLWESLRKNALGPHYKFIRQEPVLGYIVDFWCPRANMVIEVDGGYHSDRQEYDDKRDAAMRAKGIMVLRYTNERVSSDLLNVLAEIRCACDLAKVDSASRRVNKGEVVKVNGRPVLDVEHYMLRTGRAIAASTCTQKGERWPTKTNSQKQIKN
jgi:very-short-patch-repair endonuclease